MAGNEKNKLSLLEQERRKIALREAEYKAQQARNEEARQQMQDNDAVSEDEWDLDDTDLLENNIGESKTKYEEARHEFERLARKVGVGQYTQPEGLFIDDVTLQAADDKVEGVQSKTKMLSALYQDYTNKINAENKNLRDIIILNDANKTEKIYKAKVEEYQKTLTKNKDANGKIKEITLLTPALVKSSVPQARLKLYQDKIAELNVAIAFMGTPRDRDVGSHATFAAYIKKRREAFVANSEESSEEEIEFQEGEFVDTVGVEERPDQQQNDSDHDIHHPLPVIISTSVGSSFNPPRNNSVSQHNNKEPLKQQQNDKLLTAPRLKLPLTAKDSTDHQSSSSLSTGLTDVAKSQALNSGTESKALGKTSSTDVAPKVLGASAVAFAAISGTALALHLTGALAATAIATVAATALPIIAIAAGAIAAVLAIAAVGVAVYRSRNSEIETDSGLREL